MTETHMVDGPITAEILQLNLEATQRMAPVVLGRVVQGLNELIMQLATEWVETPDVRETQCGLLLADMGQLVARIVSRDQCAFEIAGNGVPLDTEQILQQMPEGLFMIVIVTPNVCITFGLPVTLTRIKRPGSENN